MSMNILFLFPKSPSNLFSNITSLDLDHYPLMDIMYVFYSIHYLISIYQLESMQFIIEWWHSSFLWTTCYQTQQTERWLVQQMYPNEVQLFWSHPFGTAISIIPLKVLPLYGVPWHCDTKLTENHALYSIHKVALFLLNLPVDSLRRM